MSEKHLAHSIPPQLRTIAAVLFKLTFTPENCPKQDTTFHTFPSSCGLACPSKKMMRSSAYIMIVSAGSRSCSGKITKDATRESSAGETGSPWCVPARGWGLNHGRSQILDAPAQAIPANVPGVVHNQLLCYIQSLRHSLICTRASDMPLPGSGRTLRAGSSCQAS